MACYQSKKVDPMVRQIDVNLQCMAMLEATANGRGSDAASDAQNAYKINCQNIKSQGCLRLKSFIDSPESLEDMARAVMEQPLKIMSHRDALKNDEIYFFLFTLRPMIPIGKKILEVSHAMISSLPDSIEDVLLDSLELVKLRQEGKSVDKHMAELELRNEYICRKVASFLCKKVTQQNFFPEIFHLSFGQVQKKICDGIKKIDENFKKDFLQMAIDQSVLNDCT